jgi:hypothetical protein
VCAVNAGCALTLHPTHCWCATTRRLQQLCKERGIDWLYDPQAAGAAAHLERLAASAGLTAADMSGQSSMSADAGAAAARASPASSSAPDSQAGTAGAEQGAESPARGAKGANRKKAAAQQAKRAAAAAAAASKQQKGRSKLAAGKQGPGAKCKQAQQPAGSAPESSVSQDATAKLETGAATDMQPLKKRIKMQAAAAAATGSDVEGDSRRRRLAEGGLVHAWVPLDSLGVACSVWVLVCAQACGRQPAEC